jgi:peptide/nickel transport system substrate-binding protein
MRKSILISVVLILVLILVLSGCSSPASTSTGSTTTTTTTSTSTTPVKTSTTTQSKYGGVMKVIMRSAVSVIGLPWEGSGGAPHRMVETAYDFLVRYDQNYNFQPRLADSWDIAPDGKSITFHLHPGIKFSDGTPFNSAAVKANLELYAPNGVRTPSLKQIASYDIIDENTIRLNLKNFDSTLMIDLGDGPGFMASPAAIAKETTPENMAKDHLVGTGPFVLSSFEKNQSIKYVKNPNYYQTGKPYLDGFEFYMVTDPVTSIMSFKKGDGQVIFGITATEAKDLKASGYNIVTTDIKPIVVLLPDGMNADSPWAKKEVREAMEYAIDRPTLAASVGEGYYEAVTQFATSSSTYFDSTAPKRDFNPQKAKELLTAAGYPTGFKTKIYASTTWDKDILVAIQTYMKDVGIDAELELGDNARMTDWQNNGWKNGVFVPGFPIIPNIRSLSFRLAGGYNVSFYKRDDWQAKVDATVAQPDLQKQLTQFRELIKIMNDDAACISLWTKPDISALDKSVQDLKWTQSGHPRFYEPQDAWLSQ